VVEARENHVELLLENSVTYFVGGAFEKLPYAVFGRLQVKLQSENVLTHGKRLNFGNSAAGERRCSTRQVECFAVPVKWCKGLGQAVREGMRAAHPLDRKPAYFFGPSRVDPRAQGLGDDLGAKAYPKHGFARSNRLANQGDFWAEPVELSFVVCAHRAAHHRQHVEIGKRRKRGIAVEMKYAEGNCALRCPISDSRRPFEYDMLQNRHAHHA
jgi:hypothetical protein